MRVHSESATLNFLEYYCYDVGHTYHFCDGNVVMVIIKVTLFLIDNVRGRLCSPISPSRERVVCSQGSHPPCGVRRHGGWQPPL